MAPAGAVASDAQIAGLRSLLEDLAAEHRLTRVELGDQQRPDAEFEELYVTPRGPSLWIGLLIQNGRRYAHIAIADWDSHGAPGERLKRLEERTRARMSEILPGWAVESEYKNLGFWRP